MAFIYICALCTKTKGHQQTKQIRSRWCHIWTRRHDISDFHHDYFSSYLEIVTEEESCSLAYNHATLTYCQGNESSKNRFVCDYIEKSTQAIGALLPDPLLQHVSFMNKWKYLKQCFTEALTAIQTTQRGKLFHPQTGKLFVFCHPHHVFWSSLSVYLDTTPLQVCCLWDAQTKMNCHTQVGDHSRFL